MELREIRRYIAQYLPNRSKEGSGGYFVDWILALIECGSLKEFVAVEIQTIDTTGSYRKERDAYMQGSVSGGSKKAGLNWENVSKRILPQLIYKGHVLRREELCKKGMFFICPSQVHGKIIERLGGSLYEYTPQPGSLTFFWYDLGPSVSNGKYRSLIKSGSKTTTVDQIATAFTNPVNLPPPGVYTQAIEHHLKKT